MKNPIVCVVAGVLLCLCVIGSGHAQDVIEQPCAIAQDFVSGVNSFLLNSGSQIDWDEWANMSVDFRFSLQRMAIQNPDVETFITNLEVLAEIWKRRMLYTWQGVSNAQALVDQAWADLRAVCPGLVWPD
jgi:hypothetical protein